MLIANTKTRPLLLLLLLPISLNLVRPLSGSSVVVVRPSSGRATLVYGQPLHFQCNFVGRKNVNFLWFKARVGHELNDYESPVLPDDDGIELHNDRLTVLAPNRNNVADYVCRLKNESLGSASETEFAVIKVRSAPYIDDFNLQTSGKSYTLTDGNRLELLCRVRDQSAPVNITWLKSQTPDDERSMVPIAVSTSGQLLDSGANWSNGTGSNLPQTFLAPDQSSILVEQVDEFSKRLVIESVKLEHRSYYVCIADNGVTERTRKVIFVRVKDKFIALWPFLGIVSEVFILFTIIHSWETFSMYQRVPTT